MSRRRAAERRSAMTDPRELYGRIVHDQRVARSAELRQPFYLSTWEDRDEGQRELDMRIGAAVEAAVMERMRAHEHEWTRCPECKQPGQPCPCSGTVCCEAERREIAAAAESATEGRERIACYIDSLAANYPEDVFTAEGTSRDAIGGTAMRHAYRNAARSIREGKHYE